MAGTSRPNVLLLVSDEHNDRVAGYAGDPLVRTPNLDSIAERGLVFENAFCQAPVCTPSRASFLTGKYVSNLSCWNNHWVLFPEHRTIAHHFADAGYETCLVGKMHYGGKDQFHGFQHRPYGDFWHALGHQPDPIDMFPNSGGVAHACASQIPESLQQENVVSIEAASWVQEHLSNRADQPWLMCASYCKPHAPLAVPSRYLNRYLGKVDPVRLEDEDEAARHPYPAHQRENYGLLDVTPEQVDRARAAYWGAVEFLDDCIGLLLWRLESVGALENTIIAYISDHGDLIGNHGLWWKANYYEEAIRAPFIMCGPSIPAGVRREELAELNDLVPTLCALCGLDAPDGIDGVDLSSLLTEGPVADAPRDHIISEYYGIGMLTQPYRTGTRGDSMRVIRTDRHKYANIFGLDNVLFDLQEDPREFRNVIDDPKYASVKDELSARLDAGWSWEETIDRVDRDRERSEEYMSGVKPSMPNQYHLPDGRIFDAEGDLYGARWLQCDTYGKSGIIPQRYG